MGEGKRRKAANQRHGRKWSEATTEAARLMEPVPSS